MSKSGTKRWRRSLYEKGRKLDPKNNAFVIGLARIETQEKHLDRAEAVLRQAFVAGRSIELALCLADCLIAQDKIPGAEKYIALLVEFGFENLGAFLNAKILVKREKWAEAIPRLEAARESLKSDPRFGVTLNLMLADCYGGVLDDERRLAATPASRRGRSRSGRRSGGACPLSGPFGQARRGGHHSIADGGAQARVAGRTGSTPD